MMTDKSQLTVAERALESKGMSGHAIYRMVARAVAARYSSRGCILDVGCGVGNLWPFVESQFDRYVGADVVKHDGFPEDQTFCAVDLDNNRVPLPDEFADVVAAVETIEHLENPRSFMRELVRLAKPGGWVVVTTPNQLSFLSKLTFLVKNQFNAFQANSYPAHLTALLEIDLRRIAAECRLTDVDIDYTREGRMPGTGRHFPSFMSRLSPRLFSDNFLVIGKKAAATSN